MRTAHRFAALLVAVGRLAQGECQKANFWDVPDAADDLADFVDGQTWECTDDGIGYDLEHEPGVAQYDKNCKKGLRAVGYFRKESCFATNDAEKAYSVTCNKKNGECARLDDSSSPLPRAVTPSLTSRIAQSRT